MMRRRLWFLIGFHAVLNLACMSGAAFLTPEVWTLPLLWAAFSVPMAQVLLLGCYVGLGSGSARRRLRLVLPAIAYLSTTQTIFVTLTNDALDWPWDILPKTWLAMCLMYSLGMAIIAVIVVGVRRFIGRVRFASPTDLMMPTRRFQFTLFQVLLLMSAVGMIFASVRFLRSPRGDVFLYDSVAAVFSVLLMTLNALSSIWATLGAGGATARVFLVLCTGTAVGLAQGLAMRHDTFAWWLLAGSTLAMGLLPMGMIVASLFVVRSCGYRLASAHDAAPNSE